MRYVTTLLAAAAFTAVIGMPAHIRAQQPAAAPAAGDPHHPEQGKADASAPAPDQHKQMMAMMAMMNDMKAADAKLDALVATMESAQGGEKTTAMAAVVKALVDQRKAMRSSMAGMMDMQMMGMMGQMKPKP